MSSSSRTCRVKTCKAAFSHTAVPQQTTQNLSKLHLTGKKTVNYLSQPDSGPHSQNSNNCFFFSFSFLTLKQIKKTVFQFVVVNAEDSVFKSITLKQNRKRGKEVCFYSEHKQ